MLQHGAPSSPLPLRALPLSYVFGGRRASVGESNEEELSRKINALADARYGGHGTAEMKELFLSYDGNGDGCADKGEVKALLKDAGIGNSLTRGLWVDGVFKQLDADGSGCITWEEYRIGAGLPEEAPPPPPAGGGSSPAPGGYTIAKEIAAGSASLPSLTVSKQTAAPAATPKKPAPVEEKSSTWTYAGAAVAGGLGALWLGVPYGVALAAGWLLSSKLTQ